MAKSWSPYIDSLDYHLLELDLLKINWGFVDLSRICFVDLTLSFMYSNFVNLLSSKIEIVQIDVFSSFFYDQSTIYSNYLVLHTGLH